MPNSYNVIFCSRNANAVNTTSLNAVQYQVNWDAILPKKFKQFHCQFVFKSENTATVLNQTGFINMNFGTQLNSFDGISFSNNLGIIYPVINGSSYFYNSTNNDNNDFIMNYPNSNLITVNLNTLSGTALANPQHYALIINFIGVSNEDVNTNNSYDPNKLIINR